LSREKGEKLQKGLYRSERIISGSFAIVRMTVREIQNFPRFSLLCRSEKIELSRLLLFNVRVHKRETKRQEQSGIMSFNTSEEYNRRE
jgi:hypothetical protein